jgi:hypothetical protein
MTNKNLLEVLRISEDALKYASLELKYAKCRDNPTKTFCEKCRCEERVSQALGLIAKFRGSEGKNGRK